jgi:general secretion pathway protein G
MAENKPPSRAVWFVLGAVVGLAAGIGLTLGAGAAITYLVAGPAMAKARLEAKTSNTRTNLQTVRSQLLLYQVQHNDQFPSGANFAAQLTQFTDIAGKTSASPSTAFPFGPYLQAVPANPFTGKNDIRVAEAGKSFSPPMACGGWFYNAETGEFRADMTDDQQGDGGTPLNQL